MKLQSNPTSFLASSLSLFLCVVLLYFSCANAYRIGNETDRFALLKFKESISEDPHGVLSSWNDSVHFCNWHGVVCSRRHQRPTVLDLEGYDLRGILSPYIGNLTFLRAIHLMNNSFVGGIPQQVGLLLRLQNLSLGSNMLEGKIPVNLSYCSDLRVLGLRKNRLTGMIPSEFGSLAKLEYLALSLNNFTGGIPSCLGNISSLVALAVVNNNLVGNIPHELGKLKGLTFFALGSNNLFGAIPRSLYNISLMKTFSIPDNHFKDNLPSSIGLTLSNLQTFFIGLNEFFGKIPESFSNASQLQQLDIGGNNFVGQVPASLGNLPHLRWLGIAANRLGNYSSNSLDFITSLTNCSQLEKLEFTRNNFAGVLPKSLANLSTQLIKLNLAGNQISGNIPGAVENLVNLIFLAMGRNLFTGLIPASLGKLHNLQVLTLEWNMLSGEIPLSIGNLTKIFRLRLSHNNLAGKIPPNIALCQSLQSLDISNNRLSGAIPEVIFSLPSLSVLFNLSHNALTGGLPMEVGKLRDVGALDLSENYLTSKIPETIGDCEKVEFLYLQGNFFQGTLPFALTSLKGLRYLDLSRNNLTGKIPENFQKLPFLLYLNFSFNDLEGEVPNTGIFGNTSALSVVGNKKLCGGVPKLQLPKCPIKELKKGTRDLKRTIIIPCVVGVILVLLSFPVLYLRMKSRRKSISIIPSTVNFLSKVSYEMLFQATDGFSPRMLIGTGGFGSVFKGILDQEENLVAIKVLNLQQKGADKSFFVECNALRNIRHRNLVKILTCCSSVDRIGNEFKALVFEYMSNGSLEKWLHLANAEENQCRGLNLIQRLNIASDVASAIHYLHEDCDQPIIHCDLKPSNVLLDSKMIAHVSDFGLARLTSNTTSLSKGQTSTINIKGTIGYTAPEYAIGSEPSKKGDVYSYGILVLEMFTGRRPTDEMFKDDFNLHNFVEMALPERLVQIIDSTLLPQELEDASVSREDRRNYYKSGGTEIEFEKGYNNLENPYQISIHLQKCLVSVLEIGLACSQESPNKRMNIADAIKELQHIKNSYQVVLESTEKGTDPAK